MNRPYISLVLPDLFRLQRDRLLRSRRLNGFLQNFQSFFSSAFGAVSVLGGSVFFVSGVLSFQVEPPFL